MPTVIPIPIKTLTTEREKTSLTYALDLDKGRIVGKVDGLAAVEQAIRKKIITPRFRCLIYDNQYGSEIKQSIQMADASHELIETEMPRLVADALSDDKRILGVYGFSFEFTGESAYIRCRIDTIYGQLDFEEVI